jgi:putative ABC transport system permease protein
MSFLARLGLKNMLRSPWRSVLSMVAVVAGVAVFVLGKGLISGLKENIIRAQVDKVSSHVMLRPADYPTEQMSHPISDLYTIDAKAAAWLDAHAEAWTRRVVYTPELIVGADSVRVRAIALDANTDEAVFPRADWTVQGSFSESAEQGVVLGNGIAKLMDLEPGQWVTLRARTTEGAVNALQVPVAGIITSGSPILDSASVLLPWDLSDKLVRHGQRTSYVNVRLDHRDRADAVGAELLDQMGDGVEYVTWLTETREILRLQDIRQRILDGLAFCLLLISATGIANTVLMAAYERIREVGTLQAMGMTRASVVGLFLIEGSVLGVLGGLLGALLGGAVTYYGSIHGIDMSAAIEQSGKSSINLPFSMMLYMHFDPMVSLMGLSIGVLMAVLASVYPAVVASRMQPADAVRA